MIEKKTKTYTAEIYIAGDYGTAKNIIREYCEGGACVSLEKVDYIYTHGEESGMVARLINYPRFPSTRSEIARKSMTLAMNLLFGLHQGYCTVVRGDETVFISRRAVDIDTKSG